MRFLLKLRTLLSNLRSVKVWKHFAALTFLGILVLVASQIFYPQNKVAPFMRLNGDEIGGLSEAELLTFVRNAYDSAPLTVVFGDHKIETSLAAAGLRPDYEAVRNQVIINDNPRRIMPFSFMYHAKRDVQAGVIADEERLNALVTEIQIACIKQPKNASLRLQDGQPALDSAQDGEVCDASEVRQQLESIKLGHSMTVTPMSKKSPPERTNDDVQPLLAQAERIVNQPFYFSIIDDRQLVPKETVVQWVAFKETDNGLIEINFNPDKVAEYLKEREKSIYTAPGTTVITLTDGVETARKAGAAGRGISVDVTTDRIRSILLGEEEGDTAYAELAVLPPKTSYQRIYNKTQAGLDALLRDLVAEKGNYGIAVHVTAGSKEGLSSSANGSRRFITASTYKLFVAYAVLKEIEAGRMAWSDHIVDSRNAEQCFEDMIVKSDNPCGKTFGEKISWAVVQSEMQSLGMKDTYLSKPPTYDNYSTAADEALFLSKLQNGELLQTASRTRLLSAMQRQIYRRGVPTGVAGTVADKVGFLYGLLHDAAIVTGPTNTYVVVIMTDGSSWGNIADAAKRIDAFLNQ